MWSTTLRSIAPPIQGRCSCCRRAATVTKAPRRSAAMGRLTVSDPQSDAFHGRSGFCPGPAGAQPGLVAPPIGGSRHSTPRISCSMWPATSRLSPERAAGGRGPSPRVPRLTPLAGAGILRVAPTVQSAADRFRAISCTAPSPHEFCPPCLPTAQTRAHAIAALADALPGARQWSSTTISRMGIPVTSTSPS
jgi:hypothetical protein